MREERIKQRYSRRQLAELVGCSPATIAFIESGKRNPSLELANKLSLALGKSVDRLFIRPKLKQIVKDKEEQ